MLTNDSLADNAMTMGNLMRDELKKINSPLISVIRGKGLLNAVVIDHYDKKAAWNICLQMKENGLLAKPTHGDKIRLAPPLIINEEQVMESVSIIKHCVNAFGK